jgi:hypothetical protein
MRAVVSIEIKGGTPHDLTSVRSELNEGGLWGIRANHAGQLIQLPNATLMGEYATEAGLELRNYLFKLVTRTLTNHQLQGKVMVVVGADLSWEIGDEYFEMLRQ